jgi:hypothetical protein
VGIRSWRTLGGWGGKRETADGGVEVAEDFVNKKTVEEDVEAADHRFALSKPPFRFLLNSRFRFRPKTIGRRSGIRGEGWEEKSNVC